MKRLKHFAVGIAAMLVLGLATFAVAQNTSNYMSQGGATWSVGGVINILSGGQLQIAGTDRTAALATAPSAVAAGYKVARGETALDGSNPTDITSGLTTVDGCVFALKGSTTPGVGTSVVTYTASAGTVSVYAWKVTNSSTTTMIASTGTETVGWVCLGT